MPAKDDHYRRTSTWIIATASAAILFVLLSIYREVLIPHDADLNRRAVLLTGDEPTYLLMAIALARGDGMNLRPAHEAEAWRTFQNRPVLREGQWTWHYYFTEGRVAAAIDRSSHWRDAQKAPFPPLLPAILSPLIGHTERIRWWNAVLWGALTSMTLAALIVHGNGGKSSHVFRIAECAAVAIIALGSIPLSYYTAQVFPEIPATLLVLWYLTLASSDMGWKRAAGAVLLALSPWATPRTLPLVGVALLYSLWEASRSRNARDWMEPLILAAGIPLYMGYSLWEWGTWFPPQGSAFMHFIVSANIPTVASVLLGGCLRYFFSNQIGLFLLSPLLFAGAIATVLNLIYLRRRADWLVTLMMVAAVLSTALYQDYRAGTCPAGRYQVVGAGLMAFALIEAAQRLPGPIWSRFRPTVWMWGMVTLAIGIFVAFRPNYWFRSYHPLFGYKSLQPYYAYLPSFRDGIPGLAVLGWTIFLGAPLMAGWAIQAVWRAKNSLSRVGLR